MSSTSEYVYLATRAQISQAAAIAANDDFTRIAPDTLAAVQDFRLNSEKPTDAKPAVRTTSLLRFPLRSIPTWVPTER